ncbi:hypothetical protein [Streptomyces sp. UG1]|uniref:hypothetical protein n=1 Tax=Streptomyces sp. UG1 TaxID=3417652 RepID=UPI003CEAE6F7
MLTFAVLLFGVLVTHGVHVESVQGHLSTSAVASAAPAAPAAASAEVARHGVVESVPQFAAEGDGHHGGGHVPTQPGEHCASGQPQQGSGAALPCFAASVRESARADDASIMRMSGADRSADGASPVALRAASVVQQV